MSNEVYLTTYFIGEPTAVTFIDTSSTLNVTLMPVFEELGLMLLRLAPTVWQH